MVRNKEIWCYHFIQFQYINIYWRLILGSRAGAIIAACWATMMYIGEGGYVESTRKIIETTKKIEEGYVRLVT